MNKICYAAVLAFFAAACCGPAHSPPSSSVAAMNESTAVVLNHEADSDAVMLCAGVWVGQVDLLTARHCVGDVGELVDFARRQDVSEDGDAKTDNGIVVAVDDADDLALLSAPRTPHGVAPVFEGAINQGDRVRTMGHSLGLAYSLSEGIIEAERHMPSYGDGRMVHVLQVFSGANLGDSGGGLFTMDGDLIGIGSFRANDSGFLFYIHRDEVLAFLKRESVLQ